MVFLLTFNEHLFQICKVLLERVCLSGLVIA